MRMVARRRLSLDDILAVMRAFIELNTSRAVLDRLLRWRAVSGLPEREVTLTSVRRLSGGRPTQASCSQSRA
jgi:hypothetical protein